MHVYTYFHFKPLGTEEESENSRKLWIRLLPITFQAKIASRNVAKDVFKGVQEFVVFCIVLCCFRMRL